MTVPYTYLIGWRKQSKYYYGVRFAKNCHPIDLWKTYFTSSKTVAEFRKVYGEPDIVQVRCVFSTAKRARLFEEKVLRRLDCAGRNDFLNKANGRAIPTSLSRHMGPANGMFGKKHTDAAKNKMRKQRKHTNRMSVAAKTRAASEDRTGVNNPAFKGMIKTPYGLFSTTREAAAAENVNQSTISWRIKNNKTNYLRVL